MEATRLDGFILEFEPKQFETIKRRLEARGYPPDSTGLKKLIVDLAEREEGPEYRIGGMIGEFIEKNPAAIMTGMSIGSEIVSGVMKKIAPAFVRGMKYKK